MSEIKAWRHGASEAVMAGLVPAISLRKARFCRSYRGHRNKPGGDKRDFEGLDPPAAFGEIAPILKERVMVQGRRIVWLNVVTVLSAAILIGAEVFGAAFAASWAIATLFDLGGMGARVLDIVFVLCGIAIMVQFIRNAHRIEPFTARS
jgi:hypothetical protein